ncbi:MAG TPA: transglycosylase SLT domain-containing protein [Aromatoleum sp.]|uniref:lytic transglycosylase domain-containing protein n=1 Tax=Aromatoleum sp. TaxID=2307007 RepID=UPI002B4863F7|nr:transglycosylase SLT domain-containing protein [Aromatoleum sp.]HJV26851.1 transglycosylase SLT domain-containing protein [Aromatoleum sp.]
MMSCGGSLPASRFPRALSLALCLSVVPLQALPADPVTAVAANEAVFPRTGRELVAEAERFEHGEGVARDPAHAAALYCEAVLLGSADAMYALGWMYANARGVARDDGLAGTLFAMAGFLGHPQAANLSRYTGEYSGRVPACLLQRRTEVADSQWDPEAHIEALEPARREIARMVVKLAPDYQISPRLALAIALTESRLNPVAVSPKSAMGVMQLIPDTAARFNVRNPFDPAQNIRGGLAYLRWLLAYFRGDVALAAAGYNAGEKAVDRYRGIPPYPETKAYVTRILDFVKVGHHPYDSRIVEPSGLKAVPVEPEHARGHL